MWRAAGVRRFAWNWALGRWHEDAARARARAESDPEKQKSLCPSANKLKAEWAAIRRTQFPWSLDVTKCASTQAIIDLGTAFARAQKEKRQAAVERRKPRKMFGFPKFKAKNKTIPGFALWNDQFAICHRHSAVARSYSTVRIPNLGWVKLREIVPSIICIGSVSWPCRWKRSQLQPQPGGRGFSQHAIRWRVGAPRRRSL